MTDQKSFESKQKSGRSRIFLRICRYLFRHKGLCIAALLLMLSANGLALVGPKLSGKAIDAINLGAGAVDFDSVTFFCILLGAVYLLSALLSYLLHILMVHLSQKIIFSMRHEIFEHLMKLPVGYFDKHATGDIISRISYDVDTINASLTNDLLQICASLVTIIGSLVVMLTISPVLVSVFLVTVPISILFTRYKVKKIQPFFRKRSGKLGALNGYAEEMLSGQKTIRAYGQENTIVGRFDERNETATNAYYDADYHGAVIGPAVNFITNLSICLIATLGGIFYMLTLTRPETWPLLLCIGLGDVAAFVQYARKFSGPINEFANIMNEVQSATAAAERVFRLLDEGPEPQDCPDAQVLAECSGDVSVDHVNFGYTEEKIVLKDLSLHADPGQTIAIVGPTGAGKSTIINLLMRFYDPQTGKICIDGKNIRRLTRDSMRAAYTMVLQDTWLFCGTVRENIAYAKPGATDEEVENAAKAAKIHEFILSLPQGYQTVLSDDGINISKGQKQLITIARAMLATSPMLILDEATSNVDSKTEQQIQSAMHALMAHRTCFVIAHRLSTVQNADMILVLRDGSILESGTHEQLLASKGFYSSLYLSQFN